MKIQLNKQPSAEESYFPIGLPLHSRSPKGFMNDKGANFLFGIQRIYGIFKISLPLPQFDYLQVFYFSLIYGKPNGSPDLMKPGFPGSSGINM